MRCQKCYKLVNEKIVAYLVINWMFLIFLVSPQFMFLHANPSLEKCCYNNNNNNYLKIKYKKTAL